ncbi:MAG: hypothetical protein KDE47_13830, partial [Caldilineaceae bacterium]|nr:hypothetical protein [Caldilineaceae bacterium]
RPQVRQLRENRKPATPEFTAKSVQVTPVEAEAAAPSSSATPAAAPPAGPTVPAGFAATPPALTPATEQVYLPIAVDERAAIRQLAQEEGAQIDVKLAQLVYEPAVLGMGEVRFYDRRRNVDERLIHAMLAQPPRGIGGVEWGQAENLSLRLRDLLRNPERVEAEQGPFFAPAPEKVNNANDLKNAAKDLSDWLYYNSDLELKVHEELDIHQEPGENERDFKIRLQQAAREARDAEVDKLRGKLQSQIDRVTEKLRKEERELAGDQADYESRRSQEWIGIGESVLGFVLGRRSSRALSNAASKRRMTVQARQDIEESEDQIAELKDDIKELEAQIKEGADEITLRWAKSIDNLSVEAVKPRRTDVNVELTALAWLPSWLVSYHDGRRERTATVAAYSLPK